MSGMTSLMPLTPLIVGLVLRHLMSLRSKRASSPMTDSLTTYPEAPQVFMYPRGIVNAIFVCAILVPLVFLLLPDSAVLDARPLFNFAAIVFGSLLLFAWLYLYKYKILVMRDEIQYGAFRISCIDLSKVTAIRYFWVGNGIHLKLFSGKKRIGLFEGGIENFDGFAKAVHHALPDDVHTETVGSAHF